MEYTGRRCLLGRPTPFYSNFLVSGSMPCDSGSTDRHAVFCSIASVTERQRRHLEQRMADRLNERTRIARELHDSLLQGFQGLMFRSSSSPPATRTSCRCRISLRLLAGGSRPSHSMRGGMRIQNLRSSTFDDHDCRLHWGRLAWRLGVGIETQSQPEYRVVVEGRPRELVPVLRDDIYRIVRRPFATHTNTQTPGISRPKSPLVKGSSEYGCAMDGIGCRSTDPRSRPARRPLGTSGDARA